jgi:adenylate cyclase
MAAERIQRRLAAILAADVVGYSRLMAADEAGTLARLRALRKALFDPQVDGHRGRIVKLMGDGALVEFPSVVDAVECAIAIQQAMVAADAGQPEDRRIVFRIGINLGDIIIEGDDIYGDGVNVAARLEGIAESGGIAISEDAWRQVQGKVPARFVDIGEQPLKNIARPVRAYRVDLGEAGAPPPTAPAPAPAAAAAARDKPSIAVLPFQTMSDDAEQAYFADGLVEDILTTLSKLAGLRVIARNSSFVYKGRAIDVREAARQLGARYVLEGSVRRVGNRVRITAQLIDAEDGAHLWAERYDRAVDDIFAIQDEITLVLATEMQVRLTEGEQARLRYTTTSNVAAWTCWAQGLAHFRQAVSKEKMGLARPCWEKALALEPGSAAINAMLGFLHCLDARFGWWDDRETALGRARAYADRALALDPGNADAHTTASCLWLLQARFDEAVADARKAVELAPGSADVAELASFVLAPSGYPEEAAALSEKAMTLSPHYPAAYLGTLGQAYRLAGRTAEAITAFRAYEGRSPGFGVTDLVIAYQDCGQPAEARQAAERLLAARRNFTIAGWLKTQFRRDAARLEADVAALRAAGLPMG